VNFGPNFGFPGLYPGGMVFLDRECFGDHGGGHFSQSWPFIAPLSFHCDMALYSNCDPEFLPLPLLSFCLNWKV
jgi:hypothetical protein